MTMYIRRSLATVALGVGLSACIGSPLPNDSVAALYEWSERDTPLTTREALQSDNQFNGDYSFVDLVLEYPALEQRAGEPWLMESCDEQRCLSMVLYGQDFELKSDGELGGRATLTPLATLMANEVRELPAGEVRGSLDELSALLREDGVADYADFIRLDTRSAGDERNMLLYPGLYDEADALLLRNPRATVQDLLGRAPTRTADLVASRSFDFDTSWKLKVDVDVASRLEGSVYLLLCSDYSESTQGYTVDYNSCALRAPLSAGSWRGELTLTGTTTQMLAVLLSVSDPSNPEYLLWRRGVDGAALIMR